MDQDEADATARDGYDRMAQAYADHVADELAGPSIVRSLLEYVAGEVGENGPGLLADVGCGPGHIAAYLAGFGLDVVGVDQSPALLSIARATHPALRFEIGRLSSLPFESGSLQAVISRHSVIHTPAHLLPAALDEFARVVAPGGLLFLSFFGAEAPSHHGEAFDHAVTTAYRLDVETTAGLVREAGFAEHARVVEQPRPGERPLPHGTLIARRAART